MPHYMLSHVRVASARSFFLYCTRRTVTVALLMSLGFTINNTLAIKVHSTKHLYHQCHQPSLFRRILCHNKGLVGTHPFHYNDDKIFNLFFSSSQLRGGANSSPPPTVPETDKPEEDLGYQLSLSSGNVPDLPKSEDGEAGSKNGNSPRKKRIKTARETNLIPSSPHHRKNWGPPKKLQHQQKLLRLSPNASGDGDRRFRVTVCQEQGARPYMEDTHLVGPDCVGIFDGHGGKAVSRYLKQNLLAELQRATAETQQRLSKPPETHPDPLASNNTKSQKYSSVQSTMSVRHYEQTLGIALDRVDKDVQKISHWSYQGSTALAAWLYEGPANRISSNVRTPVDPAGQDGTNTYQKIPPASIPNKNLTLVVANIGDSRAILSRNGQPISLTRDHKPNDADEYSRIVSLGGKVTMRGRVARVNGNLALSRAIGDRSERPFVVAEPEFTSLPLRRDQDEFILLATDGLWDVMTNKEVVDFVLSHAQEDQLQHKSPGSESEADRRDEITRLLVEEALSRGSYDNITIIIVWLRI